MDGQDVLRETAQLVERGWCHGAEARDVSGAGVAPDDPAATAWSLVGALARTVDAPGADLTALRDALWGISAVIPDWSLETWNDAPGRTQAETLQMLSEASTSLRREPPPTPWPAE